MGLLAPRVARTRRPTMASAITAAALPLPTLSVVVVGEAVVEEEDDHSTIMGHRPPVEKVEAIGKGRRHGTIAPDREGTRKSRAGGALPATGHRGH